MTLAVRYVFEHSLRGERGPALLRWLLDHGADEFSVTVLALQDTPAPVADAFEDALGSFERAPAPRRVLTSPTSTDFTRMVRLWTLSSESLGRLLEFFPEGLFQWPTGPDGWLEDLTVYRAGELALGLVSHEREGALRLTPAEHAAVAALGVVSEVNAEWIGY
jgi:hypothetical protein